MILKKPAMRLSLVALSLLMTSNLYASGFQLWEQNAAGVGDYHAGRDVRQDASAEFYNPAALTEVHHQQMTTGVANVFTHFKYKGNVTEEILGVKNVNNPNVTAQGGIFKAIPNFHYAAPINDRLGFGFGISVPFGLATSYGKGTDAKYVATLTSVQVINFSVALGYKLNHLFSLGAGIDIARMDADFEQVLNLGTLADPNNFDSINKGHDYAYGYHAGLLFTPSLNTQVGLTYHSQMSFRLHGTSKLNGVDASNNSYTNQLRANVVLPPYTSLSIFHKTTRHLDLLGSVTYTQWNKINDLILKNVATDTQNQAFSNVIIHEGFKNTWNFAIGAHYHLNSKFTLKTGAGYDISPTTNRHRDLRLPDSNRIALSIGAHYQPTTALGLDAGWTHLIAGKAKINKTQEDGLTTNTSKGTVSGGADVIGLQLTYNFN